MWFDKHLLVLAVPGASESDIRSAIGKDGRIVKTSRLQQLTIYKVFYESGSAMGAAELSMKRNPRVLAVQKNLISNSEFHSTAAGPMPETRPMLDTDRNINDPYFSRQVELSELHVPSAWRRVANPASNTIALVSTGAWANNPESNQQGFYDAVSMREGTASDLLNRGSLLGAIAAAKTNNSVGIASPARYSMLLPINVTAGYSYPLGSNRNGIADDSLIEAVSYCARPGRNGRPQAPIVLLDSVFDPQYALHDSSLHPVLHMVLRWFHDSQGGIVVCPYGANTRSSQSQPLPYLNVVGNLNAHYDSIISFTMPGSGALSADRFGNPVRILGSGASAALFAGLAGLVWSANPSYSNLQVERALASSCTKTIAGVNSGSAAIPPGGLPMRRLPGFGMPDAALALGVR
jgi:hypothetical protein